MATMIIVAPASDSLSATVFFNIGSPAAPPLVPVSQAPLL